MSLTVVQPVLLPADDVDVAEAQQTWRERARLAEHLLQSRFRRRRSFTSDVVTVDLRAEHEN